MVIATEAGTYPDRLHYYFDKYWPELGKSSDLSSGPDPRGREATSSIKQRDKDEREGDMRANTHDEYEYRLREESEGTSQRVMPDMNLPHHIDFQHGRVVDSNHHVPLLASAEIDEDKNPTGKVFIDHRVPSMPGWEKHAPYWIKHELDEVKHMKDLTDAGMDPHEAYDKSHAIATTLEHDRVRADAVRAGLDPDKHLEEHKQFGRDAAGLAAESTDRPRHVRAHTTVYDIDPKVKYAEYKPPEHRPLQIDVMNAGVGIHSGPGNALQGGRGSETMARIEKAAGDIKVMAKGSKPAANENIPFSAASRAGKLSPRVQKLLEEAKTRRLTDEEIEETTPGSPGYPVSEESKFNLEKSLKRGAAQFKSIEDQYREVEQKISPERLRYTKALAEQRGDKNLLESIKSYENWKQSMDITRALEAKKPMLKVIEGGKE